MLHHLEINVSDLKESTAFWGWFLGSLGYDLYQDWPEGRSWRKEATYIVIKQTAARFMSAGYHRARTGLDHVAFHANSRQHVDETRQTLRNRGVPLLYEDRYPHAGGPDHYALFFEAPDRIKVELVAPTPAA